MKRGILWSVLFSVIGVGSISAFAATYNSTNFSINGNLGDSAAGGQSSTSYQLTSAAGESIAGNASSKSYKMGQGYVPTLENSLQVVTQPSALAAYWPLDEVVGGGPMYDESQYANNGFYEASSVGLTGKVGNAWATFNTSQYGSAPDSPSYPDGSVMTISAWIRAGTLSTQQGIVSKWNYNQAGTNYGEWALQTNGSNQIRMFLTSGAGDDGVNYIDTTNAGLTTNTWTHVAAVYDGSQAAANRIRIYINGVQASTTVTGTIPTSIYAAGTNPVYIGDFNGLNRGFSGSIDEVKIYSRPLNANEIKADYAATNVGIPAGLGLGSITPGVSQTSSFDSIVQTSAGGYSLGINQNYNLRTGTTGVSADFSQDFDGFSNGASLTTGNTGFSAISNSNGATFTASTDTPIHNTFGRFQTTAQSTAAAQFSHASTSSRYYRYYFRLGSMPATAQTLFNLYDNVDAVVSALRLQPDGTIQLRNGNIAVDSSSYLLTSNQWVRVELFYNAANSTQTMRLFTGSNVNGDVASETLTGPATNGATVGGGLGIVTGQASQTFDMDSVATTTTGWLGPTGGFSIPSVSGTIASPTVWSEGTTKGLGFTLYGTNATSLPGTWGSGGNYAAIPAANSTFYTRTNYTAGAKDVINMRLRLDVATSQQSGDYANQMTIVGTMTP